MKTELLQSKLVSKYINQWFQTIGSKFSLGQKLGASRSIINLMWKLLWKPTIAEDF